jgi:hypothetical protein
MICGRMPEGDDFMAEGQVLGSREGGSAGYVEPRLEIGFHPFRQEWVERFAVDFAVGAGQVLIVRLDVPPDRVAMVIAELAECDATRVVEWDKTIGRPPAEAGFYRGALVFVWPNCKGDGDYGSGPCDCDANFGIQDVRHV